MVDFLFEDPIQLKHAVQIQKKWYDTLLGRNDELNKAKRNQNLSENFFFKSLAAV